MRDDMQRKSAHPLGDKLPSHLIGVFNEPALLSGESSSPYWDMVSALIDEQQPDTFVDWMRIRDIASSQWEEQLFRRATFAIIRGGQRQAVHQFIAEIAPGENGILRLNGTKDTPAHRAAKFFIGRKNEKEDVHSQVANYGIGEAELFARSAQNNRDAILMFEGIVGSRGRTRRKLQKELKKPEASRQALPSQEVRPSPEIRPSQEVKSEAAGHFDPTQVMKTKANDNAEAHHHGRPGSCLELANASTSGKGIHGSCQEEKSNHAVDEQPPESRIEMIDKVVAHRGQ